MSWKRDILNAAILIGQLSRTVRPPEALNEEEEHATVTPGGAASCSWSLDTPEAMNIPGNSGSESTTATSFDIPRYLNNSSSPSDQVVPSTSGTLYFDTIFPGVYSVDPLSQTAGPGAASSAYTNDYVPHQGDMWYRNVDFT